MIKKSISCFLLVGLITSLSFAQDGVIYDNGVVPNTGLASQNDVAYPFESQVADDFVLSDGGTGLGYDVSGVDFTGLGFNQPPNLPNPTDFNVFIYADNGAGTAPFYTGNGTSSPAGDAICSASATLTGAPIGTETYSYSMPVSDCKLALDTTYWVTAQAEFVFPPQFGWQGSTALGGNAVSGFPLLNTPFWTTVAPGTEMDFQIIGKQQVPEPATGLMLLFGLAGLGFCRRR